MSLEPFKSGILSKLPISEQRAIAADLSQLTVKPGELVVTRGRIDTDLYILADGHAHVVRRHKSGKEIIINRISSGDLFGELSLISGAPRSADVRAVTQCRIFKLSRKDFARIRSQIPECIFALLLLVTKRLADTTKHLAEAALLDLPTRLLLHFNELAISQLKDSRQYSKPANKSSKIQIEIAVQSELAQDLGVTRESINRAIRELEENGEIEREGRNVTIVSRS